jgi:2-polyprenyl-3-methyl-5-hydroxy-6-metoxy-1,4-benzoquinol methylase
MSEESRDNFLKRRNSRKLAVNQLEKEKLHSNPRRDEFFEAVYDQAVGDAANVPWADLEAKQKLVDWLNNNSDHSGRAIDVGCGLGDNAEALANAGYETIGFDFSQKAIDWANNRFPESAVRYQKADLFDLPDEWKGRFDLVHECYTLQSIPPETLENSIPAVASLVAPEGLLLVYSRVRKNGDEVEGPPWPLEEDAVMRFVDHGLTLVSHDDFILDWKDRKVPHVFYVWRKSA